MSKTDKIEEAKALLDKANKLLDEAYEDHKKQSKPKIDFSKLPKDTLVEVGDGWRTGRKRYFSGVSTLFYCYTEGATSSCAIGTVDWRYLRILENPPVFWQGGDEPPIPDGIKFKFWLRCGEGGAVEECASKFHWKHAHCERDIIGYQILEMDEVFDAEECLR